MIRIVFVVLLALSSGCAVFIHGETLGQYEESSAQAYAVRKYSDQYTKDNLGVAASPFGTARRVEVQAPVGSSVSLGTGGWGEFWQGIQRQDPRAR